MVQFVQLLRFLNEIIKIIADIIDPIAKATNDVFDNVLPYVGLLALVGIPIVYCLKNIEKHKKRISQDKNYDKGIEWIVTLEAIFLFEELVGFVIFWLFPAWLARKTGWAFLTPTLRWVEFILVFILGVWMFSREYGQRRGITSAIGHIVVILAGWFIDRWLGILFFSLPLILGYYLTLYQIALILIPATTPEDKLEKQRRFIVLLSYTWGIQFPMIVVNHAWEKPHMRIDGDFTQGFPTPGIIWTKSHQVAAVTGGNQFKHVDGPGVVFTSRLERPFQIIDLRNQFRTSEIDVVSKDGISYKARVFSVFRMDPEVWDKATYDELRRKNPLLRGADSPSYTKGSFPFSHLRIQATLSTTSTQATDAEAINYWDQWALNLVEEAARKVLSQRTLDQLWRPEEDQKGKNALDNIAAAIKAIAYPALRESGILLVVSRVVNFRFPTDGEEKEINITKQQITSWRADWERKRTAILDDAEAESDRSQQEARAYAESILLNSIAEGLEKTQEINPDLPKYVIAMRFLSSLQDYIHKQPQGEAQAEKLQTTLRDWQSQFFPENHTKRPQ